MKQQKFKFAAAMVLLAVLAVQAQQAWGADDRKPREKKVKTVYLQGSVYDSFTHAALEARVLLMRTDSTVVDSARSQRVSWSKDCFYYLNRVPEGHYILKASAEGYEDATIDYEVRRIVRNMMFKVPHFMLKRRQQEDVFRDVDLDGVEVVGTRVKIAYRGDTIVYNASAFNLPEGSMLDGLVRQMPGAELKDNGDIYVNGKKVDYLMLNGRDFFKGKNKVMLENLPYYTVKEVKVYDRSTELSQLMGHDVERRDFVMDVQLKRDYARGLLGNVEGGLGTENRYLSRLFASYFSDLTTATLFGQANNVNENRTPGEQGEWSPANMPEGLLATRQAGMNLVTSDRQHRVQEMLYLTMTDTDGDYTSHSQSETFSGAGSLWGSSSSARRQRSNRLAVTNNINYRNENSRLFGIFNFTNLDYSHGRTETDSERSTLRQRLVNAAQSLGLAKQNAFYVYNQMTATSSLPWGDQLRLTASGSFSHTSPDRSFSRTLTTFAETGTEDFRHIFADQRQHQYDYLVEASYDLQMAKNWYISNEVQYVQRYNHQEHTTYRLDWLGGMEGQELGWLPSTHAELLLALDAENSTNHAELERDYNYRLGLMRQSRRDALTIHVPVSRTVENMHYRTLGLDTLARRAYNSVRLNLNYQDWTDDRRLDYDFKALATDFAALMPAGDNSSAVQHRLNNPGLKFRHEHNLSGHYRLRNDSVGSITTLDGRLNMVQHAWGTRTAYNATTGSYATMSDNVDGNWNANLSVAHSRPLGRQRLLQLEARLGGSYAHSVDFDMAYVDAPTATMTADLLRQVTGRLSRVNTTNLDGRLNLRYQKNTLTVQAFADMAWRRSTGNRQGFSTLSACDYSYGLALQCELPWHLSLATDMKMFSRRGYQTTEMNSDDLVWNAQLSRSFLKGRLTAKLTAFDLLHQLSNKQYVVNAQGWTETWNNCIPRYLMLSAIYKVHVAPKK